MGRYWIGFSLYHDGGGCPGYHEKGGELLTQSMIYDCVEHIIEKKKNFNVNRRKRKVK